MNIRTLCGRPANHYYPLYPVIKDIEHTKTKAQHPQTNGSCERSHNTVPQELCQVAFKGFTPRGMNCSVIQAAGWSATTGSAPTKARCVAGAPL